MREDTDTFDSLWWTYVEHPQEPEESDHRKRWAQESAQQQR